MGNGSRLEVLYGNRRVRGHEVVLESVGFLQ